MSRPSPPRAKRRLQRCMLSLLSSICSVPWFSITRQGACAFTETKEFVCGCSVTGWPAAVSRQVTVSPCRFPVRFQEVWGCTCTSSRKSHFGDHWLQSIGMTLGAKVRTMHMSMLAVLHSHCLPNYDSFGSVLKALSLSLLLLSVLLFYFCVCPYVSVVL